MYYMQINIQINYCDSSPYEVLKIKPKLSTYFLMTMTASESKKQVLDSDFQMYNKK